MHIVSPLYVRLVRTKNGFCSISIEYIGVLDSYFILGYIIIKYRSGLIKDKIYQLLTELWPLISELVSTQYLKNELIEFDNTLGMH